MTTLEKLSHVSVVVVSCIALAFLVEHRLSMRPTSSEPHLIGRTVDVEGVDWKAAPVTLLFHLSSTCPYCAQSAPFYERLAAARVSLRSPTRLLVASADSLDVMKKYLASEHFGVDDIVHVDKGVNGTHATPIILAVDSSGVVRGVFYGKLDPSRETEVMSILKRGRV